MQNRQNGRRRRGGNNNPRPMGMPSGGQTANRLEVRVRGNANQLLEKYKVLARDAHQSGDRVAAEYYLQHADHYFRVLNDSRIRQEEMRARRGIFDPLDDDSNDEELEREEAEREERAERQDRGDSRDRNDGGEREERGNYRQRRDERPRDDRPRDDRVRDDRNRDERNRDERPREDRVRDDRPRDDRNRDDRNRDDRPRDERPREDRRPRETGERVQRAARPRDDERDDPGGGRLSDGEAALAAFGGPVSAPVALPSPAPLPAPVMGTAPVMDSESGEAPAPRRRGRPRKVVAEAVPADSAD